MDAKYEVYRRHAEELQMGTAKLAGAADIPDDALEEAVIEHIAMSFYWAVQDALEKAHEDR